MDLECGIALQDALAGSRELSNSHEQHPTRLSLILSVATPQAAQLPGMGKKGL
jgi:hypothetical protein